MKLGRAIVVLLVLFIVSLICLTVVSLTNYFSLLKQNSFYKIRMESLQKKISSLNEDTRQAYLYKQWADRIIFRRMNYKDSETVKGNEGVSKLREGVVPGSRKYQLDVDEFDVRKINLELDFEVSFKLINVQGGNRKQEGYLFIVAGNEDVTPAVYSSWPSVKLKAGLPRDYRKGLRFSIRYLKVIKGRITQPDIGPRFNRVDVITYSADGKILMKRGYYIERFLNQSPYANE